LLVGAPAGSVVDVVARQFAGELAPIFGQPVIVENKPSAGGIVALESLSRSAPDGYTLALVHMGQMSVAPSLFERLPYDTLEDFTHVGILFRGPQVLVVHLGVGAKSLGELVALARARELRYASPGNGTPTHVFMERFKRVAGVRIVHVPYNGPASLLAVLDGQVDMLLEGTAIVGPQLRAGKLRALAVTGARRLAVLPDVPTFAEQGISGMDAAWVGVVGPRGLPKAIVARIHDAFAQAAAKPEIRASFAAAGRELAPGTPEAMRETIAREIPRWRSLVEASGLRPD
jgi:tripartite-type tricarboxylate transporter receptor subunit TctC